MDPFVFVIALFLAFLVLLFIINNSDYLKKARKTGQITG